MRSLAARPDGTILAGGDFTIAGGHPSARLAIWLACGQPCDGDVNCDGNLDGLDAEVMARATGGDTADFCQPDPDFNHDGNLDGFDVEAVEIVTGGGPCP